jgi:hypothetical protein
LQNFEEELSKELSKYGLTLEEYDKICEDITDKIDGNNDLDWSEIKDKYNVKCAADTIRKASSTIFGGDFRIKYFKYKLAKDDNQFSQESDIDKKIEELRKERIKLQTANIERGRVDRNESRQEMYYEYVGSVVQSLPIPDFYPLPAETDDDIEYLVTVSDLHYGATFVSENNEYSPTIAKDRMNLLAGYLIDFIEKHNISKLHIVSLGDLLQGLLRVSDLKINDSSIVKATVDVSRLMASFLNSLSAYTSIEYYHVPTANHCQLRSLGTKASELADEDLEYIIGNYISDLCKNNERIHVNLADEGKQYIDINIKGHTIVAMHGHQIKNIETSIRDLSMLKREFIDYLVLGHYHCGKEITSAESCCNDVEILLSPSIVGSDPYSDSLMKGSKAAVKVYGFDYIYGHTETYKFILN